LTVLALLTPLAPLGEEPTTHGSAAETAVSIDGTGFQTGATVNFDEGSATSVAVTATQITCQTPALRSCAHALPDD
jgi:hypothetical protein